MLVVKNCVCVVVDDDGLVWIWKWSCRCAFMLLMTVMKMLLVMEMKLYTWWCAPCLSVCRQRKYTTGNKCPFFAHESRKMSTLHLSVCLLGFSLTFRSTIKMRFEMCFLYATTSHSSWAQSETLRTPHIMGPKLNPSPTEGIVMMMMMLTMMMTVIMTSCWARHGAPSKGVATGAGSLSLSSLAARNHKKRKHLWKLVLNIIRQFRSKCCLFWF